MSLALATTPAPAIYLSAADLAELPGFPSSERRAREAAARLQMPSRPRAGKGGGLEYAVDALPAPARMAAMQRIGFKPLLKICPSCGQHQQIGWRRCK